MPFFFILFFFLSLHAWAQPKGKTQFSLHVVWLKDKTDTPYSIWRPQAYLSPRAIANRQGQGINIDEHDLPISPTYVQQVTAIGVQVQNRSKWLNAILVHTSDQDKLNQIKQLPFVKEVSAVGDFRKAKPGKRYTSKVPIDESQHIEHPYGHAAKQIEHLNGHYLHALGYQGQGVHTVVVDGGFSNAYRTRVFDSLYLENRMLGARDFVDGDDWIYEHSTHGTNVLSTMAANIKGFMVGTAPKASYYLFKTEDMRNEYVAEEWYWVAAMEYADSLGVDVVNSSLGYSVFAEKFMSHRYEDLDGQTTVISRGAEIATAKGLLIVNAAGNDGARKWKYLFAPADVSNVLTVAAVTDKNERASFSSWGPTPDGRIKPDVAAIGDNAVITSIVDYSTGFSSGTSYSSPILCGLVVGLRQAFPFASNEEIRTAVKQSGHLADNPNEAIGYGSPNFLKAYWQLSPASIWIDQDKKAHSNQKLIDKQIQLLIQAPTAGNLQVQILSSAGKIIAKKSIQLENCLIQKITLDDFATLPQGAYQVFLQMGKYKQYISVFK